MKSTKAVEAIIQPVFAPFNVASSAKQRPGAHSAAIKKPFNPLFLQPIMVSPQLTSNLNYHIWGCILCEMKSNYSNLRFIWGISPFDIIPITQVTDIKADTKFAAKNLQFSYVKALDI
jgi:hypothetical protein